jgi:hypothetical protein
VKSPGGSVFVFAGTEDHLYRLVDTTWNQVSRTSPAYTNIANSHWEFALFEDLLVASNGIDTMQGFVVGTDSQFSDLGTNSPITHFVGFTSWGHLIAARTSTNGVEVYWSPFNNPGGDWNDLTTGSDFETLKSGGEITKVVSNETPLIFSERAIHRLSFLGQSGFSPDLIEEQHGCTAPGSVATVGQLSIYLSEDGLYATTGQGPSDPIGYESVNEWLLKDAKSGSYNRMSAVIDPRRLIYYLAYVGQEAQNDIPNRILLYNLVARRFAVVEQNVEWLANLMTPAYTMEQISSLITTNLDSLTVSLDDRQ